jgi:hypothetical protein
VSLDAASLGEALAALELAKQKAVGAEDYYRAAELKAEADTLRASAAAEALLTGLARGGGGSGGGGGATPAAAAGAGATGAGLANCSSASAAGPGSSASAASAAPGQASSKESSREASSKTLKREKSKGGGKDLSRHPSAARGPRGSASGSYTPEEVAVAAKPPPRSSRGGTSTSAPGRPPRSDPIRENSTTSV